MSKYKVRSRDLVDMASDIKAGTIILSPHFQRKLVWRLAHKVDFIKTILLGFPFPEIFLSRGTLDVVTMKSTSCIVDGQQRMNTIVEYLADKFEVDERKYSDLTQTEKEDFLKFEIAIIDLDLPQNDPKIKEIFQRLNRTFYALSQIEKISSEYASSEYMLVAKMMCGELRDLEDGSSDKNIDPDLYKSDPNISKNFIKWGNLVKADKFIKFIVEGPIFSVYEIQRQVHLAYTLNLISTIESDFYNRNEQLQPNLFNYADEYPNKDEVVNKLNWAAKIISDLKLPESSPWYSKSNAFTLLIALVRNFESIDGISKVKLRSLSTALKTFLETPPDDYALAAREAVNNKRQRMDRNDAVEDIINEALELV
ncbi:DUF262 domain-containing protein [Janthinobacterium sp. SUN206]|uniref:DUF262 domain-containing protein n=1 Tax=Janthinobacterium sp. SUN206 TaxID=3014787 RepID=UPI002712BC90|nr:DUF262 domain-containing protein [Janthinobacterium sp. SUN206]MDO8065643.1 DUF262 domain-containing protein [Janthinobacterium sp. SUN206]